MPAAEDLTAGEDLERNIQSHSVVQQTLTGNDSEARYRHGTVKSCKKQYWARSEVHISCVANRSHEHSICGLLPTIPQSPAILTSGTSQV